MKGGGGVEEAVGDASGLARARLKPVRRGCALRIELTSISGTSGRFFPLREGVGVGAGLGVGAATAVGLGAGVKVGVDVVAGVVVGLDAASAKGDDMAVRKEDNGIRDVSCASAELAAASTARRLGLGLSLSLVAGFFLFRVLVFLGGNTTLCPVYVCCWVLPAPGCCERDDARKRICMAKEGTNPLRTRSTRVKPYSRSVSSTQFAALGWYQPGGQGL